MAKTSGSFSKDNPPKVTRKGSPNKATQNIREAYKMLIEKNLDNLTTWLERVAEDNPQAALGYLKDLSEFVVPKLARTDLTSTDGSMSPVKQACELFPPMDDILKQSPDVESK